MAMKILTGEQHDVLPCDGWVRQWDKPHITHFGRTGEKPPMPGYVWERMEYPSQGIRVFVPVPKPTRNGS